jgi:hypothetical protein
MKREGSCSLLEVKELSLRPYPGKLFVAASPKEFELAHEKLFRTSDVLTRGQLGQFVAGCGRDEMWTYLVWAEKPHALAHELSHVILHVFERCGIDPRGGNGEPFCYMLSQLFVEADGWILVKNEKNKLGIKK